MQDETPRFIELSPSLRGNRYNEAERHRHCEEWKRSGLSKIEYSKRKGIAPSSLCKWVNENKAPILSKEKSLNFVCDDQSVVEIILKSGNRIKFPRTNELLRFIRALESCS